MAQGEYTKEEARETIDAFAEVAEALNKKKQIIFFSQITDIMFFLERVKRAAPEK